MVSGSDVVPFVQEDGVWVQPAHWLRSEELARRPSKRDSPRMEPGEVPPGVEEELNTLLANFPSGLMASRLLVEFRLFFGKELNMGTYLFEINASTPLYSDQC